MLLIDLIVLVPLVAAVAAWALGARGSAWPRWMAAIACVAQAVLVASVAGRVAAEGLVAGVSTGDGAVVWSLVMDGLSLPFVALTAVVGLLAISASWNVDDRPGQHFGLLLLLQAAVAGVFLADSLLLFYIAWESVLIPMYLLIGGWGSAGARRAATKFLVYTFAGGAVLLVGVILALVTAGSPSIATITAAGGVPGAGSLLFWVLAVGLLVKVPVVPLHTWLPDAHTEAPTAGSIVLAGVLLKMGGYGMLRVALPFAPEGFADARVALAALGLVGIVWGAATALVQTDLKRLVAYSSVAHMGFVVLAISVGSPTSFSATVLTMVSHGLVAGLLFYLVGWLYGRTHTRELARFGGLGAVTPRWAVAFVIASLASAGLPGLSGFPGEYATALETLGAWGLWTLVVGVGVVLAAAYNLRAVRGTVQGEAGEFGAIRDLSTLETVTVAAIIAGIVALGVAPWTITESVLRAMETLATLTGWGA